VLAQAGANLCFKMAWGQPAAMSAILHHPLQYASPLAWFVVGNVIGFLCAVFLTLALRNRSPKLICALCFGGGFFFLQLSSCVLFKSALTVWQWFAICLIGSGIVLLRVGAIAPGWKRALPGWRYRFPADHGAHRDFKTEWWYFTGRLRDGKGREFGYQVTFFREGVRPPGSVPAECAPFIPHDVKFAHFALTDAAAGRFRFQEKISRSAFGAAGFNDGGRFAWIGGWSLGKTRDGGFSLKAAQEEGAVDLLLQPEKGFVIHGANGISQKADGAGRASHYYSSTRLRTTGRLGLGGKQEAVTGESWFDHEWSTNSLTREQIGWDWFSIQLDDGAELMLYQIRRRDGGIDPNSSGTFVLKNGEAVYLGRAEYDLVPGEVWKSGETGANYPVAWQVKAPKLGIELEISTPLPGQELARSLNSYWEGLIEVRGRKDSLPVTGHGYMELTGYAKPLIGMGSE